MTFREYIDALFSTGLFGKNKGMFARALFKEAITEPNSEPSLEAIKSWMYGNNRHCDTSRYFTNGSVEKDQFIAYFRKHTRDPSSWKKIQAVFRQLEPDEAFRIDLDTDDRDVFFWSLLIQFQRIFRLPESEREGREQGAPVTTAPQELSPEQIHAIFLDALHRYKIMDIINREPPILNRKDWHILDEFVWRIEGLRSACASRSSPLCLSIPAFIDALHIKADALDACLNITFGPDDENASFNMEGDENFPEDKARALGLKTIPDLLYELIPVEDEDDEDCDEDDEDCDEDEYVIYDPIGLIHVARDADWKTFRRKMNHLYDDITSWKDEP